MAPESGETFDVIVVLGGPEGAMRRRTEHAVRLVRRGLAPNLILSGGIVRRRAECEVMRGIAIGAGVAPDRLVLEPHSRNTLENAVGSRAVMARRGWTRALVVTDRMHLPRALLSFRAAGVQAKGSGAPPAAAGSFPLALYRSGYEALGLAWYAFSILTGRHRRVARDMAAKTQGGAAEARP